MGNNFPIWQRRLLINKNKIRMNLILKKKCSLLFTVKLKWDLTRLGSSLGKRPKKKPSFKLSDWISRHLSTTTKINAPSFK